MTPGTSTEQQQRLWYKPKDGALRMVSEPDWAIFLLAFFGFISLHIVSAIIQLGCQLELAPGCRLGNKLTGRRATHKEVPQPDVLLDL